MKNYKTLKILKSIITLGPLIGVGIVSIAASCGLQKNTISWLTDRGIAETNLNPSKHQGSIPWTKLDPSKPVPSPSIPWTKLNPSKPVPPTPPTGNTILSPYMDVFVNSTKRPVSTLIEHHINNVTLAFVQKANGGASWGSGTPVGTYSALQTWTSDFKAKGGNIAISFGGANGQPLWYDSNVDDAYSGMEKVIQLYHPERIDFDVEGWTATKPAMTTLVGAANKVHQANPNLKMSLTLAADPNGFNAGIVSNKVLDPFNNLDITPTINIMAMDYGPAAYSKYNDMYKATLATITKTTEQASTIFNKFGLTAHQWLEQHYGVTPMIGQNDTHGQMWTFENTEEFMNYSKQNSLKLISYWSLTRDFPGPYSAASSGDPKQTKDFEFYDHFYQGLAI